MWNEKRQQLWLALVWGILSSNSFYFNLSKKSEMMTKERVKE